MCHLKDLIKRSRRIIREGLCYAVGIWIALFVILRKLQGLAGLILECEGEGAALYLQLRRRLLSVNQIRLSILRQLKDDGTAFRHDNRISFHVIRYAAEYLRAAGHHRRMHGIGESRAVCEIGLLSGCDGCGSICRRVFLLIFVRTVTSHRLGSIIGYLGTDIIICQRTVRGIDQILRDILRHTLCKGISIRIRFSGYGFHVGIAGNRDQVKLVLLSACLLNLTCTLHPGCQVQRDLRADVFTVAVILPDLCVGNLLRLVHATVSEASRNLQVLIIFAVCASCCPRESGIKRAVIDVAAAFRQTFRAGILIPCPRIHVIQREIIEDKRIVLETVALPKLKGIVFPFYGILPVDGDLRQDLAIIACSHHADRIWISVSGNVEGYIRAPLQVVTVIPFRIDLVDNTALLDILNLAVIITRISNLITLSYLDIVFRLQRGGIAVIAAVVASRNKSISDLYLTINDIILKKVVKCACVSIFVSKSPYSILFDAEIGCQLLFTETKQVGDMPAIISRERIDADLLLIPVCRTVYPSGFIYAEDLDHNWTTRGSISAVNPCFVEFNVHVLVALTVDIVVCYRNRFNKVCPAGIILGKSIVKVMS